MNPGKLCTVIHMKTCQKTGGKKGKSDQTAWGVGVTFLSQSHHVHNALGLRFLFFRFAFSWLSSYRNTLLLHLCYSHEHNYYHVRGWFALDSWRTRGAFVLQSQHVGDTVFSNNLCQQTRVWHECLFASFRLYFLDEFLFIRFTFSLLSSYRNKFIVVYIRDI